jgi:cellulose synthase/poly-beta-1,6-N-acetylglucosamine synthase-like glycosyltransferase
MNKSLVIIPTFNEAESVPVILKALLDLPDRLDILVVDDGSPDGTADICRALDGGRGFQLNFHSGRVTRRIPEINFLFSSSEVRFADDYKNVLNHGRARKQNEFKSLLKRLLELSGFYASLNTTAQLEKITSWVLGIRGHYSKIKIQNEIIKNEQSLP